jgi:FeS assembly protein IscX
MDELTWDDPEEIAELLNEEYPDVDPLYDVRFTELREWVIALDGFVDDPEASTEGQLEAIQMAWNDLK